MSVFGIVLITLGAIFGLVATSILVHRTCCVFRDIRYRKNLNSDAAVVKSVRKHINLSDNFFAFAEKESVSRKLYGKKGIAGGPLSKFEIFKKYARFSGLPSCITLEGICEARIKFALLVGLFGFLVGIIFSLEFSISLAVGGLLFGFYIVGRWILDRSNSRANEMERNLSEMLDVMSICLKSGLSLDLSIDIYCKSFDSALGRDFLTAKTMWQTGLRSRDEALRDIAYSYDSSLFSRTIESIIRSMHLGSSLTEGLVDSSKEARAVYRSKREEEVCKAPIKMMIPTGTLILPAMLLLILGPVLLELAYGGF